MGSCSAAGCVMPPAPRTIPASGVDGAPRASMTSARVHGRKSVSRRLLGDRRGVERAAHRGHVAAHAAARRGGHGQDRGPAVGGMARQLESADRARHQEVRLGEDARGRTAGHDRLQPAVSRLRQLFGGRLAHARALPHLDRRAGGRHRLAPRGRRAGTRRAAAAEEVPDAREAARANRAGEVRHREARVAAGGGGLRRRRALEVDRRAGDGRAAEGSRDRSGRRLLAERLELSSDARPDQVRARAVGAARRQALHHRHQPQRQRAAAVRGR